jgi:archaellum component FlaC
MKKVPLEDQINCLETVYENLSEAINILKKIDSLNPQILHKQSHLEEIQAAINTLKWLEKNKQSVVEAHRRMAD